MRFFVVKTAAQQYYLHAHCGGVIKSDIRPLPMHFLIKKRSSGKRTKEPSDYHLCSFKMGTDMLEYLHE